MSRTFRLAVIGFVLLAVGVPESAVAQDDRRVGVVMAAPLHVGLLQPVTGRVAVRPALSWSRSSIELDANDPPTSITYVSDTSSTRFNIGASLLFFLGDDNGLRTYVAPGYAISRSSMTSESRLSGPGSGENTVNRTSTQTSHEGRVVFGAEHTIGARFRVFGEFGLAVSTTSQPATPLSSGLDGMESRSRGAGTIGAVGVVLLF